MCIGAALVLAHLTNGTSRRRRRLAATTFSAITFYYARTCWLYADTWTDGVSLWSHALSVQEARAASSRWLGPGGPTVATLTELGMQLHWKGRNVEARLVIKIANEILR